METTQLPRSLGNGLVLRTATPEDAEALAAFNARIHSDHGPDQPDLRIGAWVRDLLTRPHPTFQASDFTIVEDTAAGKIVSSLNLISQTWMYEDIPFGVGRPELVGTDPAYRKQGLVRTQFELIHEWSRQRGEWAQAITGIPYYYRQFGYEMTLNLSGGRSGMKEQVPFLASGEAEPVRIRTAGEVDIPFIHELYQAGCRRYPVWVDWTPEMWRYEILGKEAQNVNRWILRILTSLSGEPLGFFAESPYLWGTVQSLTIFELKPGVSYLQVSPAVARHLWQIGQDNAARDGGECMVFNFNLGEKHPAYDALPGRLIRVRPPYAYYMRVPDLPGFILHIAPVLERRLAGSACQGHSGELKLTFYRGGLRLAFDQGRLAACEPWQEAPGEQPLAAFPNLTFLHLLFGHRSLDDLRYIYPDCWVNDDKARPVLEALFPKRPSDPIPVS